MNDREKMLALVAKWREEGAFLNNPHDHKEDRIVGKTYQECADTLEALLTEPTLEEVLAELGHYGVPQLWETPDGWRCMVTIDQGIEGEATEATPLQAARKCLRRVKEVGSE